jgi:hypothetical protein
MAGEKNDRDNAALVNERPRARESQRGEREGKRNRHRAFDDHFIAIVERNGIYPYANLTGSLSDGRRKK